MFENVLIYLATVFIIYFFWNCCKKVLFIRRLDTLPGPKTLPLIGNVSNVYHAFANCEDFMDLVLKFMEDYSSLCQVWIGSKLIIGIYNPDEVKTVLYSENMDKAMLYKYIPLVGKMGLLTAPVPAWNRLRKMTGPTFSSDMLQGFFNTFVEQSIRLTDDLEKVGLNGNEIIYVDHVASCVFRIACDSLMGIQLEPNKNHQFVSLIKRGKSIIQYRVLNAYMYFSDVIFNLSTVGREQKEKINVLYSLVDEMIQQYEDEINNSNTTRNEEKRTHRTFFDIQMDACSKENFTRKEICDNIITMLITGSDSISTTINFVLFMLANFPEIQEKVYEELLEIYGTETVKSAPIKYHDLQNMHYLDRVIKETLRIFPTVPLIGRQVTEDLKIGEVVIPKGADIVIAIIKMHRDEKYWSNPLVFNPDRFLPEKMKDFQAFCYSPFSVGSRNCIGIKYAIRCIKVMLATLIRTYEFKVNKSIELNKIKLTYSITISPVEPFKVKIKKRSNKIV